MYLYGDSYLNAEDENHSVIGTLLRPTKSNNKQLLFPMAKERKACILKPLCQKITFRNTMVQLQAVYCYLFCALVCVTLCVLVKTQNKFVIRSKNGKAII